MTARFLLKLEQWTKTIGTVIGHQQQDEPTEVTLGCRYNWVIRFVTICGNTVHVLSHSPATFPPAVGREIDIRYNPSNPKEYISLYGLD